MILHRTQAARLRTAGVVLALAWALPVPAGEQLRYRFNGLLVEATVARGAEAQSILGRFLERMSRQASQGSSVWHTNGPWRQVSVMDGPISRVLQMRGDGAELEVISSTLDTHQPQYREPEAPLWLPPASVLASQIQFLRPTASSQWIYRSTWRPPALFDWLRVAARMRGWRSDADPAPGQLQFHRGADRLNVTVAPPMHDDGLGAIVVMTSWSAR